MTPQQRAFEILGKYCYINRKWNDKGISIDFNAAKTNAIESLTFHVERIKEIDTRDEYEYWLDVIDIIERL